jgi:hypothetical protein
MNTTAEANAFAGVHAPYIFCERMQIYNDFTMNKTFTQAPLPFMGQKRRFQKLFKQALNEFTDASIFIDLFGGSGLLSHTAKRMRPDATVVYNDYDDYHVRLLNIPKTNCILAHLRALLLNCEKDKSLTGT